jgi:hypothetical protein
MTAKVPLRRPLTSALTTALVVAGLAVAKASAPTATTGTTAAAANTTYVGERTAEPLTGYTKVTLTGSATFVPEIPSVNAVPRSDFASPLR